MKKFLSFALLATAITLVSCGSSGWKCTNHYGKTEKQPIRQPVLKKKTNTFAS